MPESRYLDLFFPNEVQQFTHQRSFFSTGSNPYYYDQRKEHIEERISLWSSTPYVGMNNAAQDEEAETLFETFPHINLMTYATPLLLTSY